MAKKRNKYTEEFKRDAVRLMRNRGTRTVAQVAADLGVPTNQLHRWVDPGDLDKMDLGHDGLEGPGARWAGAMTARVAAGSS